MRTLLGRTNETKRVSCSPHKAVLQRKLNEQEFEWACGYSVFKWIGLNFFKNFPAFLGKKKKNLVMISVFSFASTLRAAALLLRTVCGWVRGASPSRRPEKNRPPRPERSMEWCACADYLGVRGLYRSTFLWKKNQLDKMCFTYVKVNYLFFLTFPTWEDCSQGKVGGGQGRLTPLQNTAKCEDKKK